MTGKSVSKSGAKRQNPERRVVFIRRRPQQPKSKSVWQIVGAMGLRMLILWIVANAAAGLMYYMKLAEQNQALFALIHRMIAK